MAKFKWDGEEYEEVSPTLGETTYVERKLGLDIDDWSSTMRVMASIFLAVRRRKPDGITWEQIEALDIEALDGVIVQDEPAGEGKAASDPLAGGSPAKRSSRAGRSGPRAAAARTKTGAGSTSST